MNGSSEFEFFRQWMNENPKEWRNRDVDITVPENFAYTFGRALVPAYERFLSEFGAPDLVSWTDDPVQPLSYRLLAPKEMIQAFTEDIIRWNSPEDGWDFGCFMPFCDNSGSYDCFDMRWPGDDDLPVVLFAMAEAIPHHEIRVAASFKYWLEKIVKFGNPMLDHEDE